MLDATIDLRTQQNNDYMRMPDFKYFTFLSDSVIADTRKTSIEPIYASHSIAADLRTCFSGTEIYMYLPILGTGCVYSLVDRWLFTT